MPAALWHLLQVSDVLDLEFASALAELVPLIAWQPERALLPRLTPAGAEKESAAAAFRTRRLPLMRGFARPPVRWIAGTDADVLERLLAQTPDPEQSPLICTTPFFAGVAERWPGPVVYWLTDLIAEYSSARREDVHRLDRRMCAASTLLCPNSSRLARYLVDTAGAEPGKIVILPNATRASNLLPQPLAAMPDEMPLNMRGLTRPVAGVIGNLAGNMDWLLLLQLVTETPWLTWVFVGPVSMHIADRGAREARMAVMRLPNTDFVGAQPYGALAGFARAFDVAVLPYRRCEPTYSGSSTRFYEHLAACRPILSTRGLEELTHKTPLLKLFDTAEEGRDALEELRRNGFVDGHAKARWQASQNGTWQARARTLERALGARLAGAATQQAAAAA